MKYRSTRSNELVSSTYALLHGIAPDGGLYVPCELQKCISYSELAGKSYQEIAYFVLSKFFTDFTETELQEMIHAAYNKHTFDTSEIAPIHSLMEKISILELYHGRTFAFKDMALSLFPHLLAGAREKEGEKKDVLILTATSGDTGKAALEGFKDVEGTFIQVFYPTDGVSAMQKEQMQKQEGSNVRVTAIHGNFDDAQQTLKRVFVSDEMKAFAEEHNVLLSSANSINIGRFLPQIVYYVSAYEELVGSGAIHEDEAFNVVVPTGNFGNILAAYIAKRMGVPIGTLICASNENHVLTDFFRTGTYDKHRELALTLSPSMDIIESSNLERFLYYLVGENPERVSSFMNDLKEKGVFSLTKEEFTRAQKEVFGAYIDDSHTIAMIEQIYNSYGYVLDPHTAVAMGAYMAYVLAHPEQGVRHTLIASTAHPYKFPNAVSSALEIAEGEDSYETLRHIEAVTGVALPKGLAALEGKEIRFSEIIDKEEMGTSIREFISSIHKG